MQRSVVDPSGRGGPLPTGRDQVVTGELDLARQLDDKVCAGNSISVAVNEGAAANRVVDDAIVTDRRTCGSRPCRDRPDSMCIVKYAEVEFVRTLLEIGDRIVLAGPRGAKLRIGEDEDIRITRPG